MPRRGWPQTGGRGFYNDTHRLDRCLGYAGVPDRWRKRALVHCQALVQYETGRLVPPLRCPPELPVESYAVAIGLALKEAA
jgi:hypothetical protein